MPKTETTTIRERPDKLCWTPHNLLSRKEFGYWEYEEWRRLHQISMPIHTPIPNGMIERIVDLEAVYRDKVERIATQIYNGLKERPFFTLLYKQDVAFSCWGKMDMLPVTDLSVLKYRIELPEILKLTSGEKYEVFCSDKSRDFMHTQFLRWKDGGRR